MSAMQRLAAETGSEVVRICDLRQALSLYSPSEFDREILRLRRQRRLVLHTGEGRYFVVSVHELQSAVVAPSGYRFVAATLRT